MEWHIPNQPWNDHANYFAALEDDNDKTVATSNVSVGYFDEAGIGMGDVPTTTQHHKPIQILNMTTPICFQKSEKPEQVNKMATPLYL